MQAGKGEDRAQAARRVERELRRLERLAARRRFRVRVLRALRGGTGAAATFWLLVKLRLAGSAALKVGLALVVGIGLAWPTLLLAVFALIGVALAVFSLFDGSGPSALDCDCSCDCARREQRAARLKHLIAQRRTWLAAPSGPAPSLRWDAKGRHGVKAAASASPARGTRPIRQ